MNKAEFLNSLRLRLNILPQGDIDQSVSYYSEIIDDRIENGEKEEDIIESLGSVKDIAEQILIDLPLKSLVKSKIKPKRKLMAWQIVLICLGSPIWLSLLISIVAVIFSVYVTIWSLVASLYAITFSFILSIIGGALGMLMLIAMSEGVNGLILLSFGLVLCGVGLLLIKPCFLATRGAISLGKSILVLIKKCIIGKGDN